MPRTLICYRRSDSAAIAGRICDRLIAHFGKASVFMDVDNIPFGIDFRQHIGEALQKIDILLVIIGPTWLGKSTDGQSRIMEAGDPVRVEVEAALGRGIPVVPVLIDGAAMPSSAELPESLSQLSYRNAAEVDSGRDFHFHVNRLIRSMESISQHPAKRLRINFAILSQPVAQKARARRCCGLLHGLPVMGRTLSDIFSHKWFTQCQLCCVVTGSLRNRSCPKHPSRVRSSEEIGYGTSVGWFPSEDELRGISVGSAY
jgi:TIR domain